ncbi:hypothetical protein [Bartonella rattimassiliensis]|uniref:Uncharacterized protein n=1 Tax=Bartonella rattimassiliensis 15908 TaxID=1094556 RepID=J0QX64_9HYPH|nr:hypothetical protein [Bartonella rattimassiliensis]EJF87764.1 hypothetical protein MCY_00065 [Bartonella rattimassiliensis 15908]
MITGKSHHKAGDMQQEADFVLKPVLNHSKLMRPSTKDYIIIVCLAIILLALVGIMIYMKPLEFFHIISKEEAQAIAQQNFQEITQESLKKTQDSIIKHLHSVGWNSVWAFLCLLPQMILGFLLVGFPLFFILLAMVKREVKEMMQPMENSVRAAMLDS